ncbi:hypothetical protein ABZ816_01545 [Actinosynnema sp. NPDC047251]|uniref:Uncharacterized protein n=1 Tax=Saccharothrix espanaensis (strain ATCC 51144 / DSM 44229 / JCM 9112 / NBRC 15066 / NRRL 15764) TaxID=1179773 RepID=K0JT38_SACES|nr:hypothetical protein [Saccharothrix espanaensis]CCH30935.1 hypothetical protein BN6_36400 [Saccharothrix espanaensis DSM 44229]
MSTTTEREFLGEEAPEGGVAPLNASPNARTDSQESKLDQDKHEHTHENGELSPLCSGNGCVQTPPKP